MGLTIFSKPAFPPHASKLPMGFGHGLGSDLELEQAGAATWDGVLEAVQGIVIVEP